MGVFVYVPHFWVSPVAVVVCALVQDRIMSHMQQNGAVILKNFELSKKPDGFRRVWEVLSV